MNPASIPRHGNGQFADRPRADPGLVDTSTGPHVGDLALKHGRDRFYARPVDRVYQDGSVDVRLTNGNHAHYDAGTYAIV